MNAAGAAPAVATTTATAIEASPLVRWAAGLDVATLPDEAPRLADLRRAELQLARAAAPRTACADALGAPRYAALHADLARARDALGDRHGAVAAWRAALDCAPRDAQLHAALARLQMLAGDPDAARTGLARALELAPQLEQARHLAARLDYLAGHWAEAARAAAAIATEHRSAAERRAGQRDDDRDDEDGDMPATRLSAAYWDLLALLARRRGALPEGPDGEPDPALGRTWPAPLWEHLLGRLDEAGLVAALETEPDARRRRELGCEALYYTAQLALAGGPSDEGRRRLARVVNLKVLYFIEHDLALAELARQRAAGAPEADGG